MIRTEELTVEVGTDQPEAVVLVDAVQRGLPVVWRGVRYVVERGGFSFGMGTFVLRAIDRRDSPEAAVEAES